MDKSIARTAFRSPRNQAGIDARCYVMDYGSMPVALSIVDATNEQHQALLGNPDIIDLVDNAEIDRFLTEAEVGEAHDIFEYLNIPGQWIGTGNTWREVLRTVAGVFLFAQRMNGKYGAPVVPDGYTLDSTWADLPVEAQQQLLDVVSELRVDYMGAGPETTLRSTHAWLAAAWEGKPIMLGGVVL